MSMGTAHRTCGIAFKVIRAWERRGDRDRTGLFDSYATVKFENGYTEEVKASDL
jgi:hypothetical protein